MSIQSNLHKELDVKKTIVIPKNFDFTRFWICPNCEAQISQNDCLCPKCLIGSKFADQFDVEDVTFVKEH